MAGYPVQIDSLPPSSDFHALVTPTVAGVYTPSAAINGGAAAGSRRIDDATPTAAETLTEQIHWQFNSSDDVRVVYVSLDVEARIVTALSGTAGAVAVTHEARSLSVTANPGDDVTAATRLLAGYPDVVSVHPNAGWVEIRSSVAITDVYAIAKLSDVASALQSGSRARCMGVKYA